MDFVGPLHEFRRMGRVLSGDFAPMSGRLRLLRDAGVLLGAASDPKKEADDDEDSED